MQVSVSYSKSLSPKFALLFMGIVFLLLGVVATIIGFNSIKSHSEKKDIYIETNATIVDYATNSDGLKAIIVEYVVDGQTYTKQSNMYSSSTKAIGSAVAVKYNPSNPSDAIWVNNSSDYLFLIIGILFDLIGAVFLIVVIIQNLKKKNTINEENLVQENLN